jgi:uncharacterized membrane protein (DUF106 family)
MIDFIRSPQVIVIAISLVVGLLMVLVFRYLSDQKAIHVAKDQLKAHLLAVRLYQDQLPVVVRSYSRILRGTVRYMRLAFRPLLFAIIPITLLIVQLDRYLGLKPLEPSQPFLVKVQTTKPDSLNDIALQLPAGMSVSAPAVHVPASNEVVWRVVGQQDGRFDLNVAADGQSYAKQVVLSPGLSRVSPVRLRDQWWERFFSSGESALPDSSPIQSISVDYPERSIRLFWIDWNWIVFFFVASLVAGFFFKTVLGIEV